MKTPKRIVEKKQLGFGSNLMKKICIWDPSYDVDQVVLGWTRTTKPTLQLKCGLLVKSNIWVGLDVSWLPIIGLTFVMWISDWQQVFKWFLVNFLFVNICCWLATFYCYNGFMFETFKGYIFSSWFICSSCVGTFFTMDRGATSFNYPLKPFVITFDIFLNLFILQIMLHYSTIQ